VNFVCVCVQTWWTRSPRDFPSFSDFVFTELPGEVTAVVDSVLGKIPSDLWEIIYTKLPDEIGRRLAAIFQSMYRDDDDDDEWGINWNVIFYRLAEEGHPIWLQWATEQRWFREGKSGRLCRGTPEP